MNISQKKACCVFAYFVIVLAGTLYMNNVGQTNYIIWQEFEGFYVLFHMMVSLFILYIMNTKLFSLSGFFLIFSYIFHFGQIIIKAISPNYQFLILDYSQNLDEKIYKSTIELSLAIITMVVIGMIITSRKTTMRTHQIEGNNDAMYKKMGWIILIVSLPLRLMIDINAIILSSHKGYLAVFNMGYSGIIYQFAYFYIIGIVLLIIVYRGTPKKATMIFLIACIYNVISMFSGGKSRPLINILLLVYIFFSVVRKIRFREVVSFFVIGYFGVMMLNGITAIRANGISSINVLLVEMTSSKNNPILSIVEEFGGTIYTVYQSLIYVPKLIDYSYGSTYIYGLSQIFVNIGGILDNVTSLAVFAKHIPGKYSMGGSYIGELYYNFGYFSIAGGLVIGAFVNKISLIMEECINSCDFYHLSFYLMLFLNMIWWVRASFADLTRPFVWGIAFIILIHYFAKHVVFLKRKLNFANSK